jgi:hypothetical protein
LKSYERNLEIQDLYNRFIAMASRHGYLSIPEGPSSPENKGTMLWANGAAQLLGSYFMLIDESGAIGLTKCNVSKAAVCKFANSDIVAFSDERKQIIGFGTISDPPHCGKRSEAVPRDGPNERDSRGVPCLGRIYLAMDLSAFDSCNATLDAVHEA